MPYLVKVNAKPVAVATLEERDVLNVFEPLIDAEVSDNGHELTAHGAHLRSVVFALLEPESLDLPTHPRRFSESGGSVGPLPDGTVIKVEPIVWFKLAIEVGKLRNWQISADTTNVEPVKAEIIAAYNGRGLR